MNAVAMTILGQLVPAHETAHQWWGDLITWSTYRDQWFSEGLANYCSLMQLQENNPAGFRQIMEKYRQDLAHEKDKGWQRLPKDAGPVTPWGPPAFRRLTFPKGTKRSVMDERRGYFICCARCCRMAAEPMRRKNDPKRVPWKSLSCALCGKFPASAARAGESHHHPRTSASFCGRFTTVVAL